MPRKKNLVRRLRLDPLEPRTVPAAPAVVYVNPSFPAVVNSAVDGDGTAAGFQPATVGVDAFRTIGDAVAAVAPGGTVIVNTATYTESVTIDRALGELRGYGATLTGPLSDPQPAGLSGSLTAAGFDFGGAVNLVGDTALTATAGGTIQVDGTAGGSGSQALTLSSTGNVALHDVQGVGNFTATAGTLSAGAIGAAGTVAVSDSGAAAVTGSITGTDFTKNGAGTLTLAAPAAYTGATAINAGTLRLLTRELIPNASAVTVAAGATLDVNGQQESVGSLAGGGTVLLGDHGLLVAGGDNTSTEFDGVLSGDDTAQVSKDGMGTWTLGGANTFAYAFNIFDGTVRLGAAGAIAPTCPVGVQLHGVLDLGGFDTTVGDLSSAGTVRLSGATLTVGADNRDSTFTGIIDGSGNLVKSGAGTLTLTNRNNYTGSTTVTGGTIRAGGQSTLPGLTDLTLNAGTSLDANGYQVVLGSLAGAGNVLLGDQGSLATGLDGHPATFGGVISGGVHSEVDSHGPWTLTGANTFGGALYVYNSPLHLGASGVLPASVLIGGTGTLDLNGFDTTIGALIGNGQVTLGSGTLTVGHRDQSFNNFAGSISGTGGLTVLGPDLLPLSGASTYTGPTTILGGTLRVAARQALPASSAVNIAAGATLDVNGQQQTIGSLAGAGTVLLGDHGVLAVGGDNTSTEFDGVLSGDDTAQVSKSGTGTWTLTGANTFAYAFNVFEGTVRLGAAGAIAATCPVGVMQGATLDLRGFDTTVGDMSGAGTVLLSGATLTDGADNRDSTFTGIIDGTGNFAKVGSGTLTLANRNNYTGATTVTGGTIRAGGQSTLPGSTDLTLAAGTTLDANNFGVGLGSLAGDGNVVLGDRGSLGTGLFGRATTFGGIISGGVHSEVDSYGPWTLTGANTFGGALYINHDTLHLGASGVLPATVLVGGVGTLDLNGFDTTLGNLGGMPNITLGGATLTVGHRDGGFNNYAGSISGTGGLTLLGPDVLPLSGANTYTGPTNILGGTLRLGANRTLPYYSAVTVAAGAALDVNSQQQTIGSLAGAGTVLLGGPGVLAVGSDNTSTEFDGVLSGDEYAQVSKIGTGTWTLTGTNTFSHALNVVEGMLRLGSAGAIANTCPVTVSRPGVLDLNGFDTTVGGIYGSGTVILGGATLTMGTDNGDGGTFTGSITGTGGVTKVGSGLFAVGGSSSYTGPTNVLSGTVRLLASNALPQTTDLNLAAGTTFDLNGFSQTLRSVTGAGQVVTGGGTLTTAVQLAANPDAFVGPRDAAITGNVLANDTNTPGTAASIISGPAHGSANLNPDGSFTYTPAAGFAGLDSFTYSVTDATGATATATVSITVTSLDLSAASDTGVSNSDHITNAAALTFVGYAPAGSTVTLSEAGTPLGSATAGADGAFAVSLPGLAEGPYTFAATAGSVGLGTISVYVDRTAPAIYLQNPADGTDVVENATVVAAYTANDDGVGLASYAGSVPRGAAIDTAAEGPHTFTVTATDLAGNVARKTATYFVTAAAAPVAAFQAAASTDPAGQATAAIADAGTGATLTAAATGAGALTVAQYAADPVTTNTFGTGTEFYDVYVAPQSQFQGLTLTLQSPGGANVAVWWNGQAWNPVSDQTYNPATGIITVHVTDTTSPSLADLTGTYLAVLADHTPPATAIAPGVSLSATYPAAATVALAASDAGSGVAATYYAVDGGAYVPYVGPFAVGGTGGHTVRFYSVDVAGNVEAAHAATVTINPADQAIAVTAHAPTAAAFQSAFPVAAMASSGQPVAITVTGPATFDPATGTVTVTAGTGTITVRYAQAGNTNYKPAATAIETVRATMPTADTGYVLNPTASAAVNATGNATLGLPGGIYVASASGTAVVAGGNAKVEPGEPLQVVGGVGRSGQAVASRTGTWAAPTDPLAGLPTPPLAGANNGPVSVAGNTSRTLQPGVYTSIQVSGNARVTLAPGVYVLLGGGLTVSGNASLTGSGVMIFNAGSAYNGSTDGGTYGAITIGGNGTVSLSPATSGTYAGVLVFQSRSNPKVINLSGSSNLATSGTIYAAGAQLAVGGSATTLHDTLVVNTLYLSGSAGAFQLTDGASSDYGVSTSNMLSDPVLTVAVQDDTGTGLDPAAVEDLTASMDYLNSALARFGVNLSWAADPGTADVHVHFAPTTPEGGVTAGVLGFTTARNDVYFAAGWNLHLGADTSGITPTQYDFRTLATHELAHALGLGESADPSSVMYEYLSPGVARREFTDSNLALINTDADRFMKAAGPAVVALPAAVAPPPGLVVGPTAPTQAGSAGGVLLGGAGDDLYLGREACDVLVGGFGTNRRRGEDPADTVATSGAGLLPSPAERLSVN